MRRIVSISFIFAAVAVMLSMFVMPHHHHGAVACLTYHVCGDERCDTYHHPHEPENTEDSHGCLVETPFIERSERHDDDAHCDASDCGHDGHIHLYALLSLYSASLPDEPTGTPDYGESIIHYHSVDVLTGGGLRAPPVVLC